MCCHNNKRYRREECFCTKEHVSTQYEGPGSKQGSCSNKLEIDFTVVRTKLYLDYMTDVIPI